jgi:hypothetical protein
VGWAAGGRLKQHNCHSLDLNALTFGGWKEAEDVNSEGVSWGNKLQHSCQSLE